MALSPKTRHYIDVVSLFAAVFSGVVLIVWYSTNLYLQRHGHPGLHIDTLAKAASSFAIGHGVGRFSHREPEVSYTSPVLEVPTVTRAIPIEVLPPTDPTASLAEIAGIVAQA